MNILAINTAGMTAQLALQVENKKFYKELDASMKHSENLLPEIEKILIEGNINLQDLHYLAVNVGPGSFTGLRISIATAKAILITHTNIKAVKLNSFEILASNYFQINCDEIDVVINALSGFYFTAKVDKNLKQSEPKMIEKTELKKLKNIVSDEKIENAKIYKFTCEDMLNVANNKISQNDFCDESDFVPLYIRPSQAEANLKKSNL